MRKDADTKLLSKNTELEEMRSKLNARELILADYLIQGVKSGQALKLAGFKPGRYQPICKVKPYVKLAIEKKHEYALGIPKELNLTDDWIIEKLKQEAQGKKDSTAASRISALSILAKVNGLLHDKVTHDFTKLSDQELVERAKSVIAGIGTAGADGENQSTLPC